MSNFSCIMIKRTPRSKTGTCVTVFCTKETNIRPNVSSSTTRVIVLATKII